MSNYEAIELELEEIKPGAIYQVSHDFGPETISIRGTTFVRFMNKFYVRESTQKLDEAEVIALCRARSELETVGPINQSVKNIITKFVNRLSPLSILEIGSGTQPALKSGTSFKQYTLSDADPKTVAQNKKQGRECVKFGKDDKLPYPEEHFDIAIAVFVFHFKIYDSQITELYRCLKLTGALIANVYLLTENERKDLALDLEKQGFNVIRINDPSTSCKNNEYWICCRSSMILAKMQDALLEILN